MDMDQVQRKDINNLMNDSLSKELDIHIGEYDEESKEYTFNINPFNYATVECNNWIMDFDELSKSYVPSGDSIIFLFNDKVKLSELSLKHISNVVFSFTALGCMVESVGFGSSVIDFVEVNSSGDVSVSLDLSKYSVNELVKLFSDDLFSIVVVLSNNLNESNSVLKDWNIQFTFKDLLLDEKEATKNRIEEFTESTYLKKSDIMDTGWVEATLTNQFNTYDGHTVKYRQIGGIVFITGIVTPKSSINFPNTSTSVKICNLPTTCTPNKELQFLQTISATYKYRLEIKSDGIYISNPSNGASRVSPISNSAYLSLECTYCLDDALIGMINTVIESVGDYNTLANKPSLNGQTLIGDTVLDIPTNTSDLVNDSDYITSSYHDNTKVDKITGKGLSTNDYTTNDKNKLALLENYDDTDIWVTLQELEENKQDNISDLDTIRNNSNKGATALQPNDNISKLTNDVGYLTTHQSLTNYYTKDETYSSEEIDAYLEPLDIGMNDLYQTKQDKLVSGSNIKTINNQSLLGSGNINIQGGGGGTTDYNDLNNKPSINDEPLIGNRELMDYDIKDTTQIYGEDLWQNDINANLYDEIQSLKNNKEDKITKKTTSGTYFTAYKQLDIVSVYMNRSNYSPTKNTWVTLGNLADGFRPLQDIYMEYQDYRIRIQTTGAIQVYTPNTPITILFNITYIN